MARVRYINFAKGAATGTGTSASPYNNVQFRSFMCNYTGTAVSATSANTLSSGDVFRIKNNWNGTGENDTPFGESTFFPPRNVSAVKFTSYEDGEPWGFRYGAVQSNYALNLGIPSSTIENLVITNLSADNFDIGAPGNWSIAINTIMPVSAYSASPAIFKNCWFQIYENNDPYYESREYITLMTDDYNVHPIHFLGCTFTTYTVPHEESPLPMSLGIYQSDSRSVLYKNIRKKVYFKDCIFDKVCLDIYLQTTNVDITFDNCYFKSTFPFEYSIVYGGSGRATITYIDCTDQPSIPDVVQISNDTFLSASNSTLTSIIDENYNVYFDNNWDVINQGNTNADQLRYATSGYEYGFGNTHRVGPGAFYFGNSVYYVDLSASVSGTGTITKPWNFKEWQTYLEVDNPYDGNIYRLRGNKYVSTSSDVASTPTVIILVSKTMSTDSITESWDKSLYGPWRIQAGTTSANLFEFYIGGKEVVGENNYSIVRDGIINTGSLSNPETDRYLTMQNMIMADLPFNNNSGVVTTWALGGLRLSACTFVIKQPNMQGIYIDTSDGEKITTFDNCFFSLSAGSIKPNGQLVSPIFRNCSFAQKTSAYTFQDLLSADPVLIPTLENCEFSVPVILSAWPALSADKTLYGFYKLGVGNRVGVFPNDKLFTSANPNTSLDILQNGYGYDSWNNPTLGVGSFYFGENIYYADFGSNEYYNPLYPHVGNTNDPIVYLELENLFETNFKPSNTILSIFAKNSVDVTESGGANISCNLSAWNLSAYGPWRIFGADYGTYVSIDGGNIFTNLHGGIISCSLLQIQDAAVENCYIQARDNLDLSLSHLSATTFKGCSIISPTTDAIVPTKIKVDNSTSSTFKDCVIDILGFQNYGTSAKINFDWCAVTKTSATIKDTGVSLSATNCQFSWNAPSWPSWNGTKEQFSFSALGTRINKPTVSGSGAW